ncbi:MAG: putative transposase [Glaciecola sp.]|jgi:putative transposase
MPIARSKQIILSQTSYYHCISRCVRKAYLCGYDKTTGSDYEHRRSWFEKRLDKLTAAFAINICAYAIMHNHNHLVLHVDTERAKSWSDLQVLERWHSVHPNKAISSLFIDPSQRAKFTSMQISTIKKTAKIYRKRLTSISYFMKALNQYIATKANKEDDCTGKFWESRFKSQALLDDKAILSCMIYVDLNPIRAGVASSLESSHYTSIKKRLAALKEGQQPSNLKRLKTQFENHSTYLNIKLDCYLHLLEQTAFRIRNARQVKTSMQKIESRLLLQCGITDKNWLKLSTSFESEFAYVVGGVASMEEYRKKLKQKKLKGVSTALRVFQ